MTTPTTPLVPTPETDFDPIETEREKECDNVVSQKPGLTPLEEILMVPGDFVADLSEKAMSASQGCGSNITARTEGLCNGEQMAADKLTAISDYGLVMQDQILPNDDKYQDYMLSRHTHRAICLLLGLAILVGFPTWKWHQWYRTTHPEKFGGIIVKDRSQSEYSYDDNWYSNPCGHLACRLSRDVLVDAWKGWYNGCSKTTCHFDDEGTFEARNYDYHDCEGCHFNGRVYGVGERVPFDFDGCGTECYCRRYDGDDNDPSVMSRYYGVFCGKSDCNLCRWGKTTVLGGTTFMADACTSCLCPQGGGQVKCTQLAYENCNEGCLFQGEWYNLNSCFQHPDDENHLCACYYDGTVACTADSVYHQTGLFS